MIQICLLGATGSIGDSTLGVVDQHPDLFRVHSIAAHTNWEKVLQIARTRNIKRVCLFDATAAFQLQQVAKDLEVLSGMEGLLELVQDPAVQTVVNGLVGSVGCLPTMRAVACGKTVALANKETMVMAGPVIQKALDANPKASIVPVDSEHNAIFQCLAGRPVSEVEHLLLTASGGPFRELPKDRFAQITVEDALKHPTWTMGRKITIDSASMMNKGLEVIEAHFLFRIPYEQIQIVVHPKSIIHSLVQFRDGSLMAQLGVPDMKVPIQCALTWPERLSLKTGRLDLAAIGELKFYPPDFERFPCLQLAYDAGRLGGTAPAVLNAANEILVASFLDGKIGFLDIPKGLEFCIGSIPQLGRELTLQDALDADTEARRLAQDYIARKGGSK
jgi:1-deoxy-D-xylulose-5-phosphate reductoisomerase